MPLVSPSLVVPILLSLSYVLLAFDVLCVRGRSVAIVAGSICLIGATALVFWPSRHLRAPALNLSVVALSRGWGWPLVAAGVASVLFFAAGWRMLGISHPHEDVYILFRYVEHIVSGHGIVYNEGGPRTEGATDFLWLIILSAVTWLGADTAIAALVLNALGAGLAALILTRIILGDVPPVVGWAAAAAMVPVVVLSHGAAASYVGFSTMLYSALALLLFRIGVGGGRQVVWLPVVGLILSLFRPDGVVIGVSSALLGLWVARSQRQLGHYLRVLVGCGVVGATYFVWRYLYFGLLLPLPLYVKRAKGGDWSDQIPGLEFLLRWLELRISPLPAAALLVVLAILLRWQPGPAVRRVFAFLIPSGLLWCSLLLAWPLQNYQWRFQAPISLVLTGAVLQLSAWALIRYPDRLQRLIVLSVLVPVLGVPLVPGYEGLAGIARGEVFRSYFETFAPAFGRQFGRDDAVLALTEAGRLPYWFDGRVEDLVGLNSSATALSPPDADYIDRVNPDVILLAHGRTVDLMEVPGDDPAPLVRKLSRASLAAALRPDYRTLFREGLSRYDESNLRPNRLAAVLVIKHLVESGRFDIYAVDHRNNGAYVHIYGFRKGWPGTQPVLQMIQEAGLESRYRSYLDVRRERGGS